MLAIADFLSDAESGKKHQATITKDLKVETRAAKNVIRSTTHFAIGGLLHQSFVAR